MYYKFENQKGQILLITLLVLTIVSIVVIGIVSVTNRDVSQVANNEKYEKLYNYAENELREFIAVNGIINPTTSDCVTDIQGIVCTYDNADLGETATDIVLENLINVRDVQDIDGYTVEKDRTLDVKLGSITPLSGYRDRVSITWSNFTSTSMEVILTYWDGGNYRTMRDVFNSSAAYDTNRTFSFNYSSISNGLVIHIGNTLSNNLYTPISMTLIPRIRSVTGSTTLDVIPLNAAGYPAQMREFRSTVRDIRDTNSPKAAVIAKILLSGTLPSIFDGGLMVDQDLILQ
jgi:hypothetical protein